MLIVIAIVFNLVCNIFLLRVIHVLIKREDLIIDALKHHNECIRILGEVTFMEKKDE